MQELRPPVLREAVFRHAALPGIAVWHGSVRRCWVVLAALGLAAGVVWRVTASAPPIGLVLDAAGLALALCALWLAPAWEQLLQDALRLERWRMRGVQLLLELLGHAMVAALALACAPLGLLLAYQGSAAAAQAVTVDTAKGIVFYVPLSALVLATLLLFGVSLVLISTALLTALRSLARPCLGLLLWLFAVLALHGSLLQVQLLAGQPATLGSCLSWLAELLTRTVVDPSHSFYLTELVGQVLGLPLAVFAVALAALFGSAYLARRPDAAVPAWMAPVVCVWVAALYAALQTYAWAQDMTRRYPGDWHGVLTSGLAVLLVGHMLLASDKRQGADWRTLLSELLWAWWALSACAVCTLPYIATGQASQPEVLWGLLSLLATGTPLLLLVRRIGAWQAAPAWLSAALLLMSLIVVVLPPGLAQPPLLAGVSQALAHSLEQPEQAPYAYWVLGVVASASLLLWPWPVQHVARRPKSVVQL